MGNPRKYCAQLPCPVCGSANRRVISTKPIETGPYALIRRCRCLSCDFRWYVGQGPEVMLESVNWVRSKDFRIHSVVPMDPKEMED